MSMLQSSLRVRPVHDVPPKGAGRYVLYWMTTARRAQWNFALDRAVDWAAELRLPVLVFEALRADYLWASERLHRFAIEGMLDNEEAFNRLGIGYYPYVEPSPHAGRGLLRTLMSEAAVVVMDRPATIDQRTRALASVAEVPSRVEEVDSHGLLPIEAPPEGLVFPTAYAFRRFLQRHLPTHLATRPRADTLPSGALPTPTRVSPAIVERWPRAEPARLLQPGGLAGFSFPHDVSAVALKGGSVAGRARLTSFVDAGLGVYHEQRSHPDADAGSNLSQYLHYGHVSAHEVVSRILAHEQWTPASLAASTSGAKAGWWGLSEGAEGFLDQVITWRELGFNMSARRTDAEQFDSLPLWALSTLDAHATDPRAYVYGLDAFADAATHDALWNAAQRQLVREGRLHNYMRMLWGKKILEWTRSPREALAVMIELNNRFALDGRDPNSYSGIFWVLGRYDRPWPVRPIFGSVRYMTSESTARKLRVKDYLRRYAE